jgi:hypothetical protein
MTPNCNNYNNNYDSNHDDGDDDGIVVAYTTQDVTIGQANETKTIPVGDRDT